jgi:hypothetical protein
MVEIRRLIWDPLNVEHIGRHRVSPREVEEVCHVDPLVQQCKLGRIAIVGPTAAGRVLVAILDPLAREGRRIHMAHNGRADRSESRIPDFASREEEAAWWDSHDLADFQDEFATIEATFAEDLSGPESAPRPAEKVSRP